jgi:hypothetical protein
MSERREVQGDTVIFLEGPWDGLTRSATEDDGLTINVHGEPHHHYICVDGVGYLGAMRSKYRWSTNDWAASGKVISVTPRPTATLVTLEVPHAWWYGKPSAVVLRDAEQDAALIRERDELRAALEATCPADEGFTEAFDDLFARGLIVEVEPTPEFLSEWGEGQIAYQWRWRAGEAGGPDDG